MENAMKYALVGSGTVIICLLLIIGLLLAKMTSSSIECRMITSFNQNVLTQKVLETPAGQGTDENQQGGSKVQKPKHKPAAPVPSPGIPLP